MRTILVVLYVFLFLLLGLPVLGIEWIISKFNKQAADISQLRIVQWGFRCVSFLSGIRLTVKGEENVPTDQAVLYIGNHRSFFDIVVTYARCPGLTGYISKDGVNKVPVLGIWMRRLYCLFLDRKDLKQGLKVILSAIDQVKSGISICIFPEGTRNKDAEHPDTLLPFKEGSFKIAQKTKMSDSSYGTYRYCRCIRESFSMGQIHKSYINLRKTDLCIRTFQRRPEASRQLLSGNHSGYVKSGTCITRKISFIHYT